LHHPENWDLNFTRLSPLAEEFRGIAHRVEDSLQFMENVLDVHSGGIASVDFFTSHEGLHLMYEEAQTRQVPRSPGWYNLATHFPWLGVRTADPAGAHVEYFRGIANPVGLKIGPTTTPERVRHLLNILHPVNEPGRMTLIHRFGSSRIAEYLPPLIRAVEASGKDVLWCCDPMHGNMRVTESGVKTRHFDDIRSELEQAFTIHRRHGTWLGGVHFELTGEDVTECLGGARNLVDADLARDYRSGVDPRLNYEQALEMAMLIARIMSGQSQ
jgi:3-deoxy-7-phosphoheptulonate synthase